MNDLLVNPERDKRRHELHTGIYVRAKLVSPEGEQWGAFDIATLELESFLVLCDERGFRWQTELLLIRMGYTGDLLERWHASGSTPR